MRTYRPIVPPKDFDPRLVNILKGMNEYLRQLNQGMASISRGEKPNAGGAAASNALAVTNHHLLSALTLYDDHSQYLYLFGRTGGQTVLGDPKTSEAGANVGLTFKSFNGTLAVGSGPAQLKMLDETFDIQAGLITIGERNSPGSLQINTGNAFVDVTITGDLGITGGSLSTIPFYVNHGTVAGVTVPNAYFKGRAGQTGALTEYRLNDDTVLSYIRPSDGAFIGPVVASGTDTHIDSVFSIIGSVTPTKIAKFEVDGFAAPVTRTLTVPDWNGTIAAPSGLGTSGQVLTSTGTTQPTWQTPSAGGSAGFLGVTKWGTD